MTITKPGPHRRTSHSSMDSDLPSPLFPIVGIGASAGGLSAFEAFFSAIPADNAPGMAFVIVQHLSPDHKSMLSELIESYTNLPVYNVSNGMNVAVNSIYIIPPDKNMTYANGKLWLIEPEQARGHRLPIDFFFRSLADELGPLAIGIILSGTGSDGMVGCQIIKSAGGLVIAQEPDTAEFSGMPVSVIQNSSPDYVLLPVAIPAVLIGYVKEKIYKENRSTVSKNHYDSETLDKIFILIRARTGHDFSLYKPKTILRRLERRLAINQIEDLSHYYEYLKKNSQEMDALFHDFLIGVTGFFRDPATFKMLENDVIPQLFANKPAGSLIRFWIPACSTGEEAYSLAILVYEHLATLSQDYTVQIFATDLDKTAIEQARAGVFTAPKLEHVSPERLQRFFVYHTENQTWQIAKMIRDMIVFSIQNVIKDPPFSRMDFISCRNLLIYMSPELQKKVIRLFHYSLNPNGILFLGTSESVGEFNDLFKPLQKNSKIYQRSDVQVPRTHLTMSVPNPPKDENTSVMKVVKKEPKQLSYREITETELIRQYAPAAVLINALGEALYFHGRTGKYLEPSPGEMETKIVKMARQGLQKELANAIRKAVNSREPVLSPHLRVKTNGDYTPINLKIIPVRILPDKKPSTPGDLYLVIFEDVPVVKEPALLLPEECNNQTNAEFLTKIATLEMENRSKDEYIQTTVEELEISSEELKSANEELQSVNEELQSTNEELETSREELQSVNEELITVNNELQTKIQGLIKSENDMNNLLVSTGVGTVFVDLDQVITRFTPAVNQVIKLIKSDVGRPVSDIVTNLSGYDSLADDIQHVLETLIPVEKEVQTKNEKWYLLRIIPYRTLENTIDGAVITFTDISVIKQAEQIMQDYETRKRLATIVLDANDAITVLDLTGQILAWNPAAERMYGYTEPEALEMNIYQLIPPELYEDTRNLFHNLNRNPQPPFISTRIHKGGSLLRVLVTATALINEKGVFYAIATTEKTG